MTFCCSEPLPVSVVTTLAPVRVICQPVAPMRAASTGNGTRSSLATSRCLVVGMVAVSQSRRSGEKMCGPRHSETLSRERLHGPQNDHVLREVLREARARDLVVG